MTPEQEALIERLVVYPGGPPRMPPTEFLRQYGADNGQQLAFDLLRQAIADRSSDDLEYALVVAFVFGVSSYFLEPLARLISEDWHVSHENIVSLLGELRDPEAVPALIAATQWVPEYLEFDTSRALAVKAIYALSNTPSDGAMDALRDLQGSDVERIREVAGYLLGLSGSSSS